jgi:hypothetical protein
MAEFVQGRGLDRCLGLPGADRHGDQRFEVPLAGAFHLHQFQLGAAMAGPVVLKLGFAPPNQDLGLTWFGDPVNG